MNEQSASSKISLSIIIVSYNSGSILEDCLNSLKPLLDLNIQIIVVDNHPDNKDKDSLEKKFRDVLFISNPGNNGFGGGNNLGAASAEGDILLFLNPDTVLESFDTQRLLSHFKSQPESLCGFPLYYPEGKYCKPVKLIPEIDFILPKKLYQPFYKNHLNKSGKLPQLSYVSGAAFAIPKDLFEDCGRFDEDYFLFFEENDLRCRLKRMKKYNPWYLKEGFRIIHHEGKSYSRNAIVWYTKSLKLFSQKQQKPYLIAYKLFCVRLSRLLKNIKKRDSTNLSILIEELKKN